LQTVKSRECAAFCGSSERAPNNTRLGGKLAVPQMASKTTVSRAITGKPGSKAVQLTSVPEDEDEENDDF